MPVYGSHGNARQEFIEGAGDAAEGFKFPAGKILLPEATVRTPRASRWPPTSSIATRPPTATKPSTFAGHAYDAIYLIAEAAKRVQGDLTPAALRDEIEKTTGFVGIGGTFNFSPTDHNGLTKRTSTCTRSRTATWPLVQ